MTPTNSVRYYRDDQTWLWLEGMQLKPEANNKLRFFVLSYKCKKKVNTYPNHKPTPYNNAKIKIVQCDNYTIDMHMPSSWSCIIAWTGHHEYGAAKGCLLLII